MPQPGRAQSFWHAQLIIEAGTFAVGCQCLLLAKLRFQSGAENLCVIGLGLRDRGEKWQEFLPATPFTIPIRKQQFPILPIGGRTEPGI